MHHDGTLEKHDVKPSRIKDELYAITNSPEGLWFVSRRLIGNTRLGDAVHKPLLMWFQRQVSTPDALFSVRDPRMSGKTDGCTIALAPWAWAAAPIEGSSIQGVNTCICVVAPKKDIASYIFVANVARRFEACEAYRELYPWVQPDENFWSLKNGLLLKRTLLSGLPSLMPLGMESVSTSLHPPILIIDDPIHEQNYRSLTEVRRIVQYIEHSHSLTGPVHGVRGIIGNYWTIGDVQDQLHPDRSDCKLEYQKVQVWERGITGCATCIAGERVEYAGGGSITGRVPGHEHDGPISPVALNKAENAPEGVEYIEEVRAAKPNFLFLTQHENILVDPSNLQFRKEWLKFWDWYHTPSGDLAISIPLPISPATEMKKLGAENIVNRGYRTGTMEIIPIHNLDIYIFVDPAPSETETSRHSRFATAAVGAERTTPREFLLEEYAKNAPSHVNLHRVLDMFVQWQARVRRIVVESVGYQATIKDTLLQMAAARGIQGLNPGMIENLTRMRGEGAQEDRIRYSLVPKLESGNFYVHRSHQLFIGEQAVFGLPGAKRDVLDAVSNMSRMKGIHHALPSGSAYDMARRARERFMRDRGVTGYGG